MNNTLNTRPGIHLPANLLRRTGLLLTVLLVGIGAAQADTAGELRIITWPNYLSPELIAEFEQRENIRVTQVYVSSNRMRDGILAESGGRGYDLAVVDGATLGWYRRLDWLKEIPAAATPGVQDIDARIRRVYSDAEGYAVPFSMGLHGIAYRSDLIPGKIESWLDLFRPTDELCGKIMMQSDSNHMIDMALRALGYVAPASLEAYQEVEDLLLEQRRCVYDYRYVDLDESSELISADVWVATSYNGDARMLQRHSDHIEFVVPREGSEIWVDYFTILRHAHEPHLALRFIRFMWDAENAAKQALYASYATPNKAVNRHLPASFLNDRAVFLSDDVMKISDYDTTIEAFEVRLRNEITARVLRR